MNKTKTWIITIHIKRINIYLCTIWYLKCLTIIKWYFYNPILIKKEIISKLVYGFITYVAHHIHSRYFLNDVIWVFSLMIINMCSNAVYSLTYFKNYNIEVHFNPLWGIGESIGVSPPNPPTRKNQRSTEMCTPRMLKTNCF